MIKKLLFTALLLCPLALNAGDFPLGLYSVNTVKDIKTVKKAGFDTIQTYNQNPQDLTALAQEAQKQGLKVLFYPDKLEGEFIEKARTWPVAAWYIYDEPGVHHLRYKILKDLDNRATAKFPKDKTTFVVGKGANIRAYADISDIIMVDWYPVPHLALTSLGQQIQDAKYYLAKNKVPDKPVWAVVQSFDWRNFKQHRPDDQRIGRFPTAAEMRFMAYHAITEGAEGIFFFHYQNPKQHKEEWEIISQVSKELAKIKPVFAQGTAANIPFTLPENFKAKAWLYKGYYYYLIVNTLDKQAELPQELNKKAYKALLGKKAKQAEPYGVYIFKKKA